MRGMVGSIAAAVMPAMAVAAPIQAEPLKPVSSWTLAYEDQMCIASRRFAAPAGNVDFGVKPVALSEGGHLVIAMPRAMWKSAQFGKVTVRIGTAEPYRTDYFSGVVSRPKGTDGAGTLRAVRFPIPRALLDDMAAAPTITFAFSGRETLVLPTAGVAKLVSAIATCEDDLISHWGYTKEMRAKVAVKPEPVGDRARWLKSSDYPHDAQITNSTGRTVLTWRVTPEGRAVQCRVIDRVGMEAFEQAACAAVTQRARYTPARDAAGAPVEAFDSVAIQWEMGF